MSEDTLSDIIRAFLPAYARAVLEAAVRDEEPPSPYDHAAALGVATTPELAIKRGLFVTLTRSGQLRGCIGHIEGVMPLGEALRENALSAAFRDPRFTPVTATELPELDIEVSVLTPPRPIADWRHIEIPRHGVVLSKSGRRAVFLPQVAAEMGWDVATTLTQLALKAGLNPEAWREGAELAVFEAHVSVESSDSLPDRPPRENA